MIMEDVKFYQALFPAPKIAHLDDPSSIFHGQPSEISL